MSGGNKRRLCVAVSLICASALVFLGTHLHHHCHHSSLIIHHSSFIIHHSSWHNECNLAPNQTSRRRASIRFRVVCSGTPSSSSSVRAVRCPVFPCFVFVSLRCVDSRDATNLYLLKTTLAHCKFGFGGGVSAQFSTKKMLQKRHVRVDNAHARRSKRVLFSHRYNFETTRAMFTNTRISDFGISVLRL